MTAGISARVQLRIRRRGGGIDGVRMSQLREKVNDMTKKGKNEKVQASKIGRGCVRWALWICGRIGRKILFPFQKDISRGFLRHCFVLKGQDIGFKRDNCVETPIEWRHRA